MILINTVKLHFKLDAPPILVLTVLRGNCLILLSASLYTLDGLGVSLSVDYVDASFFCIDPAPLFACLVCCS